MFEKNNDQPVRLHKELKEALDELKKKQGRTMRDLTRDLGMQIKSALSAKPSDFEPVFKLPKLDLRIKNKKGGITDVFFVVIIIFVVALGFLFISTIWTKMQPRIATLVEGDAEATTALSYTNTLASSLDNIFLIFFVFMVIAIVILAFQVGFHPIFYFIFVIVLVIGYGMSVMFSNTYEKVQSVGLINSSQFTIQNYILNNLPGIFIGIGLFALLAIYFKIRTS